LRVNCFGASAKAFRKIKSYFDRAGGAWLLMLLMVVCLSAPGCQRQRTARMTPAQVHQVTQELAKAASDAAPTGSVVKIRRANKSAAPVDELQIVLRGSLQNADGLQQQLAGVATQHRLTVDAPARHGNAAEITLRSGGVATHRIEIEVSGARAASPSDGLAAGAARLAILMDDLGNDRSAADAIFALHAPVTLSVLPYHPHSQEIAREARKHGCEVMLHLPMRSVGNETAEQQELSPGLSREQVETIVTNMLEAIPEANGVNNHQGSQATSNGQLMNELMPVLKDAGVFYVDSRTTAATVAYDSAKRAGLKTAYRNVPFLDDVQDKTAVKRQLQIAIRGAREKGEAIAIGHPHTETLEALRDMLPEARKQGVRLVFVSDVVH
jgi:uncharacterized protein